MNHLILYAHPNPRSFNHAILETVVQTLRAGGHQVLVRDLYELDFEPVLRGAELVGFKEGSIPDDIRREQEHVRWADVITCIYPIWWTSMPAILKGYIDRVFAFGFAYDDDGGLLQGKKAVVFHTQGENKEVYDATGMTRAMQMTTDTGIFEFCGMDVLNHTFFGEVPYVDDAARHQMLEEVVRIVREF